ncbi:MAG: MFS transporter [Burkholderiales bacterium]|nr:MFS transporter [Burkholderiales bacterium]
MSNAEVLSPAEIPRAGLGRDFYLIWVGQAISMLGTQLTGFAFSVWTARAMQDYALYILVATLPALVLLPWTGGIADRYDRKKILLLCELSAMVCMALLALLAWRHALALWHVYSIQLVLSAGAAFQGPAARATIVSILPKEQLGRAGGLFGLTSALTQFGGPILASGLLVVIGMRGIVAADMVSYGFAVLGLFLASIPTIAQLHAAEGKTGGEETENARKHPFADLMWSIDFLRARPSMAFTYAYTALGGFLSSMMLFLATPTVIARYSPTALPWVTSAGAIGMLLGGLLMVAWGGPKKWSPLLLGFNMFAGLAVMAAGASPSLVVLCICALLVMMCNDTLSASMQSIWQRKVPKAAQGRFTAFQQIISISMLPLSSLVASTLYSTVEPAFRVGGSMAGLSSHLGTGAGGTYNFLFCLVGLASVVVSLLALAQRRLYRLEEEVPDAF